jgi:hypothetical protein
MREDSAVVTYFGLYFDLCGARARIPQQAAALQQAMTDEGWPYWGQEIPGFAAFWQFLEGLQAEGGCPGCHAGGGDPGCQIRACAQERGLARCGQCPDFPCQHIMALAERYPTLIFDNRRLQAVGLEQWLAEQAERARRGVVYADMRYADEGHP